MNIVPTSVRSPNQKKLHPPPKPLKCPSLSTITNYSFYHDPSFDFYIIPYQHKFKR